MLYEIIFKSRHEFDQKQQKLFGLEDFDANNNNIFWQKPPNKYF